MQVKPGRTYEYTLGLISRQQDRIEPVASATAAMPTEGEPDSVLYCNRGVAGSQARARQLSSS